MPKTFPTIPIELPPCAATPTVSSHLHASLIYKNGSIEGRRRQFARHGKVGGPAATSQSIEMKSIK
jgi:hypothetical protein